MKMDLKDNYLQVPIMVGGPHYSSIGSTGVPIRPINSNTFRCIQPELGSSAEWPIPHRGHMVSRGSNPSHQLSGVASCLSSNQGIWEDLVEHYSLMDNITAVSYINQKEGGGGGGGGGGGVAQCPEPCVN